MLDIALRTAMRAQGLSSHSAAEAIGVSHTTILRALRGDKVDADTVIKIANWLKVRPSELINSMEDTALSDQLAVLLGQSPDLEKALAKIVGRIKAGTMEPAVLRDVISYAVYKSQNGELPNVKAAKSGGGARSRKR